MHANVVRTYEELYGDIKAFADDKYNFMMLLGQAGVGKSEAAKRFVPNALTIDTKLTAFDLYQKIYKYQDAPIIIDDVPNIFRNADSVAMLKSLTDSRAVKTVSWNTASTGSQRPGSLPKSFETRSRLLLIANEWKTLDENVRALESRAVTIIFEPSVWEVHQEVQRGGWFHDQVVYDFMYRRLRLIRQPSFRSYVVAAEQRRAGRPWETRAMEWFVGTERLEIIQGLFDDHNYKTDAERAAAFEKFGHGDKRTYARWKAEWLRYREPIPGENPKLPAARTIKLAEKTAAG
jgi:hypothetical protein